MLLGSPQKKLRDALVAAFIKMTPVFTQEGEEEKDRISRALRRPTVLSH